MPVVKNIVKDASGAILDGTVTVDLIVFDESSNAISFQGFVDIPADNTSDYTINIPAAVPIISGSWSMTLKGNADISDAYGSSVSTYYRVTENTTTINRVYYIDVPSSGGPYWVGNIGALDPTVLQSAVSLNALSDVDTSGVTDGQLLGYDAGSATWVPKSVSASSSGTWTPTATGPGTMPGTWTGAWEKVSTHTYHVAIALAVTGSWSGLTTATVTASLPSGWVRHADKTMHLAGHATSGTTVWNIVGMVDPFNKSATAPTVKFFTPNISTSSYNYTAVNGVGTPFTFASGYSMEVSGILRVA